MALDDLQRDLKLNTEEAKSLLAQHQGDPLLGHIVNTLWPFQEAVLEELNEMADALDAAVQQSDDLLHGETAGVFAAVILGATRMADELDKRLLPSETEFRADLVKIRTLLTEASVILEEITVPDDEDDEEDDDDDDDNDETEDADEDDDDDTKH